MRAPFLIVLIAVLALGCSSPVEIPCPTGAFFTHSLIHPDSIRTIDPLGNVNPPGHTFPTDHQYINLKIDPLNDLSYRVNLYAPADLKLVRVRLAHRVNEDVSDFALDFQACERMVLILGHVGELEASLLGADADYSQWPITEEYSTGGETYQVREKQVDVDLVAGQKFGETGADIYQLGIDVGFYDYTRSAPPVANRDRWGDGGYLKAAPFLEYHEEGPLLDALAELVYRLNDEIPDDPYPYGLAMQDVPGTAHGSWFKAGEPFPPEDAHLALVNWNSHPLRDVFSVGNSVTTLQPGIYPFFPEASGRVDRYFADITPDGLIYAYHPPTDWTPGGWEGTILIQMPDEETLWIEGIEAVLEDPADWVFTAAKTEFKR